MNQQNKTYELPTHIMILGKKYKIKYYDRDIIVDGNKAQGHIDIQKHVIYVRRNNVQLSHIWQILLYTIMYAMASDMNLRTFTANKKKQSNMKDLRLLANCLVDLIYENSEAFSFKDFDPGTIDNGKRQKKGE